MRYFAAALSAALLSSAVHAADTPLYQPAPAWAQPFDAVHLAETGPVLAIYEDQTRIDGATVYSYEERAWRLNDPSALTRFGTLTLDWMPDQGDLIIHKVELIRDMRVIDVLAASKFTVLRREAGLEKRVLNGALTATLAVPGMQQGDILHLVYGRSESDRALGGHIQSGSSIPRDGDAPEQGRIVTDWPVGQKVQVGMLPQAPAPELRTVGGRQIFEITLPTAKGKSVPDDAPGRFRSPPLAIFSDFSGWGDVSKTFFPLFAKAATLPGDGPLAVELGRIRAASPDKHLQMLAALQLVQDKIAYLENGMNGGNYIPQLASDTWTSRNGDCKAKTALLLALLGGLGISAEPLLVNATVPDLPSASVPVPLAFNHVIVRAHLDGNDYFLDGTAAGASRESLTDRSGFRWGLPVTVEGSDIVALPSAAPAKPSERIETAIDLRAGPDFPGIVDSKIVLFGPGARQARVFEQLPAGRQRDDVLDKVFAKLFGDITVVDRSLTFSPDNNSAILSARFIEDERWKKEGKVWTYAPIIPDQPGTFKPDRSRSAWNAIPVEMGTGDRGSILITMRLPEQGRGATLAGGTLAFASRRASVERTSQVAGDLITVTESVASDGGELAPADIPAERVKSATLDAASLKLRLPVDARRSWQMVDPASRGAIAPLLATYAQLIASRPDESYGFAARGYVYQQIGQFALARADFDRAVSIDGSALNYGYRADLEEYANDLAAAVADRTKAHDLDPTVDRLTSLTFTMNKAGQAKAAAELLDNALDTAGDDKPNVVRSKALALGWLGRQEEGMTLLSDLIADHPGDADTLDFTCWYRGLWNVGLEGAQGDCDKAVTLSNNSASALHSRSIANLRKGNFDAALSDIEAARDLSPGMEEYLLTRGMIRVAKGDAAGGRADIVEAERRHKSIGTIYRAAGLLK